MDLKKSLTELGLSDSEAAVYLSCLQLGNGTVLRIAESAELKRPTVYLVLEQLGQRGLVKKTSAGKKTFFRAEPAQKILDTIHAQQKLAQKILPSLQAVHNLDPEKPNITIAEGIEGVRRTYRDAFTYLRAHPQEELLIFGALKDALEYFQKEVLDYFYTNLSESKNPTREIGNDDTETRQYYRESVRHNPRHDIRLVRNEGVFVQSDNLIYGNTLVMLSLKRQIFATRITSSNIVQTYRTLFEMSWRSGKPI